MSTLHAVPDVGPAHPTQRLLLGLIARNPAPGMALMREATRLTKAGVLYALARLMEDGWVIITQRGGGRGFPTVYALTRTPSETVQKGWSQKGGEKVKNGRSAPRARALPGFDFDLKDQVKDLNLKNTLSAPFPFEAFYAPYPRKTDRADAEMAWRRLDHTERATIMESAERWMAYWKAERTALKYVPGAAPFIHGRYKNEPPTGFVAPASDSRPHFIPTLQEEQKIMAMGLSVGQYAEQHGMWT